MSVPILNCRLHNGRDWGSLFGVCVPHRRLLSTQCQRREAPSHALTDRETRASLSLRAWTASCVVILAHFVPLPGPKTLPYPLGGSSCDIQSISDELSEAA